MRSARQPSRRGFALRSVFVRIAILLAFSTAIVAATLEFLALRGAFEQGARSVAIRASEVTQFVADQSGGALKFGKTDGLDVLFARALEGSHGDAVAVSAFNLDGEQVYAAGEFAGDPANPDLWSEAIASGDEIRSADGMSIAVPVRFGNDNAIVGAVAMEWTLGNVRADLREAQVVAIVTAVLLLVATLGLSIFVLSRSVTRPLLAVGQAMEAVSRGDYRISVPATGRKDEIGRIAATLEEFRGSLALAEAATRESVFKGAGFEGSSAALLMADTEFRVTYVNAAFRTLLEASAPVLRTVGGPSPETIIGADLDIFRALEAPVKAGFSDPANLPHRSEVRVAAHYFSLDVNAVRDPSGALVGYVAEWKDITAEHRNAAILSALDANQALVELTPDGRIASANENFCTISGRQIAALAGQEAGELLDIDGDCDIAGIIAEGKSFTGRIGLRRPDGTRAILEGVMSAVRSRTGETLGFVLIGADVTDAQRVIAEGEARRKEMEAAQALVVSSLQEGLAQLADGDLTAEIEQNFSVEYEGLRTDYNMAVRRLREAIGIALDNAVTITSEVRSISTSAENLARRTESQAASVEETVAAVGKITEAVEGAAQAARQANQVVRDATGQAETSGDVVRQAVEAMSGISESSQQISKIISVIEDIAFQTNLLALNAGVEAARAGSAGTGFAVVASEVRALAQRSSEAAREIGELISASGENVKRGVVLVGDAGSALKRIIDSVSNIARHVGDISAAADEQSVSLNEINSAMLQLDQVSQQNAAMFEETTAASRSLTGEAELLNETMSRFRIGERQDGREDADPFAVPAPRKVANAPW